MDSSRWFTQSNDPLWSQESIWSAIRCLPALRTLCIDASFLGVNLESLDTLITLESISTSIERRYEHEVALFHNISNLYASSANLISIEFDVPQSECDLHQLVARKPTQKSDSSGRRLRRLAVCNVPVHIYEDTLSHLKNLTSLKLLFKYPLPTPDKFWNALKLSRIYLEELEIGHFAMGHAVNNYLSSFSGLKKLKLYVKEEESADKFWWNAFPNDVDTLQDFSLRSMRFDKHWCFGDHNRSVIAKCTKLRRFTITVPPDDFPKQSFIPEIISTLIETALTHMPHIKRLGVDITCDICLLEYGNCYGKQLT